MKKVFMIWSLLLLSSFAAENDDGHPAESTVVVVPHMNEVVVDHHDDGRIVEEDRDEEERQDHQPSLSTEPIRIVHDRAANQPDEDEDSLIQSCGCEKQYDQCTSVCWTISAGWWNLLGFTAGQAATILQVLSTIGTDNPDTFSTATLTNFLIAGAILTQSSASFHALQLHAKQTALSRKEMAERIQVIEHKMAAKGLIARRITSPSTLEPLPKETNKCLKWYNTLTSGFWRIAGGWFNTLGFLSSQTAVILQFLSPLAASYPDSFHENAATNFLIASTVLTQLSTCFHAFEGYAYKAALERSTVIKKKAPEDLV
jgi:uncharacterized membrane protein YccF (DUF307 family)